MAKFIKNIGKNVICFEKKNFIPGEAAVEVTDVEASNPTIVRYIAAGKLELTEEVATGEEAAAAKPKKASS